MSTAASPRDELVQLAAFVVGREEYVIDIRRLREIIRPQAITPVRRGPRFVEGVISLRGEVIPVIDLRRRFGLPEADLPHRKVVIVWVEGRTVGLIVDAVTEVLRVQRDALKAAPGLLDAGRAPYFSGVCHHGKRVLILINVKNIISSADEIAPPSQEELLGSSG